MIAILFDDIHANLPDQLFTTLLKADNVRIERIILKMSPISGTLRGRRTNTTIGVAFSTPYHIGSCSPGITTNGFSPRRRALPIGEAILPFDCRAMIAIL